MIRKIIFIVIISCTAATSVLAQDAMALLKKAEGIMYPDSFFIESTLSTKSPVKRDTSMTFEIYHKDKVGTFMEIIQPARSKGIRFLQKDDNLWMYNPKARSGNAIRLSSRGSFQGSTFSNNDMSDPDYSDDYTVVIAGSETLEHSELGKVDCLLIEGNAKTNTTTYAKIKMWIRKSDYMPLRIHYFVQSGLLFKKMDLSGYKQIAGRIRPTIVTMESMDMKGTISTMTIDKMIIRDDLPSGKFTESALTR